MKYKKKIAVLALTGALVLGAASPAQAYGGGSGIGGVCGGGWAWKSYFSGSSSYAQTTKSGNACNITAAIRIYYNEYNHVNSATGTVVITSRAGGASGGRHWNGVFWLDT